jgi:hypothetical protein
VHVVAQQERRVPGGPAAFADSAISFREAPRRSQEQREREVGRRLGEDARRVAHEHALARRRFDIDVVVADSHRAHDAQPLRLFEDAGVDVVGEEAEEAFGVA